MSDKPCGPSVTLAYRAEKAHSVAQEQTNASIVRFEDDPAKDYLLFRLDDHERALVRYVRDTKRTSRRVTRFSVSGVFGPVVSITVWCRLTIGSNSLFINLWEGEGRMRLSYAYA